MDKISFTYAAQGGKCGSLHQPGFSCVCLQEEIRKNMVKQEADPWSIKKWRGQEDMIIKWAQKFGKLTCELHYHLSA